MKKILVELFLGLVFLLCTGCDVINCRIFDNQNACLSMYIHDLNDTDQARKTEAQAVLKFLCLGGDFKSCHSLLKGGVAQDAAVKAITLHCQVSNDFSACIELMDLSKDLASTSQKSVNEGINELLPLLGKTIKNKDRFFKAYERKCQSDEECQKLIDIGFKHQFIDQIPADFLRQYCDSAHRNYCLTLAARGDIKDKQKACQMGSIKYCDSNIDDQVLGCTYLAQFYLNRDHGFLRTHISDLNFDELFEFKKNCLEGSQQLIQKKETKLFPAVNQLILAQYYLCDQSQKFSELCQSNHSLVDFLIGLSQDNQLDIEKLKEHQLNGIDHLITNQKPLKDFKSPTVFEIYSLRKVSKQPQELCEPSSMEKCITQFDENYQLLRSFPFTLGLEQSQLLLKISTDHLKPLCDKKNITQNQALCQRVEWIKTAQKLGEYQEQILQKKKLDPKSFKVADFLSFPTLLSSLNEKPLVEIKVEDIHVLINGLTQKVLEHCRKNLITDSSICMWSIDEVFKANQNERCQNLEDPSLCSLQNNILPCEGLEKKERKPIQGDQTFCVNQNIDLHLKDYSQPFTKHTVPLSALSDDNEMSKQERNQYKKEAQNMIWRENLTANAVNNRLVVNVSDSFLIVNKSPNSKVVDVCEYVAPWPSCGRCDSNSDCNGWFCGCSSSVCHPFFGICTPCPGSTVCSGPRHDFEDFDWEINPKSFGLKNINDLSYDNNITIYFKFKEIYHRVHSSEFSTPYYYKIEPLLTILNNELSFYGNGNFSYETHLNMGAQKKSYKITCKLKKECSAIKL